MRTDCSKWAAARSNCPRSWYRSPRFSWARLDGEAAAAWVHSVSVSRHTPTCCQVRTPRTAIRQNVVHATSVRARVDSPRAQEARSREGGPTETRRVRIAVGGHLPPRLHEAGDRSEHDEIGGPDDKEGREAAREREADRAHREDAHPRRDEGPRRAVEPLGQLVHDGEIDGSDR